MSRFGWTGTDERGRRRQGEETDSELSGAAARVRAQGFAPVEVRRLDPGPGRELEVTADAFAAFNRNLAEMTRAGLPLSRAVRELSLSLRAGRLKEALGRVEEGLNEGRTLDEAVAAVPEGFPPYYRWMLKAGARSGNLPAVLSAVARNTETTRIAKRALLEALAYPTVIVLITLALCIGFSAWFLPFYRDFCANFAIDPPITLKLFLRIFPRPRDLAMTAVALAATAPLIGFFLRRTVAGERFFRRLPLLGRVIAHLRAARFLGALSVLLRARTPLPEAIPVAIGASGSLELSRVAGRLEARAAEGRGLSELLAEMPGLPSEVSGYLALAERLDDTAGASEEIARLLTAQAESDCEYLYAILMPGALAFSGLCVGFLVIQIVTSYFRFVASLHP